MSWFQDTFAKVSRALQSGWTRLVEGISSVTSSLKAEFRAKLASVPAAISSAETKSPVVEVTQTVEEATTPSDGAPFSAAVKPEPCRNVEVKRGSHAARALFHDAFKINNHMGVFEITSNACSLAFEDSPPSSAETQSRSPFENSGTDSEFTPTLDRDASGSPSESTAPTTPVSDVFSAPINVETKRDGVPRLFVDKEADDDLPLSALMIRGVRNTSRRHGISGPMATSRNDKPSWLSSLRNHVGGGPTSVFDPRFLRSRTSLHDEQADISVPVRNSPTWSDGAQTRVGEIAIDTLQQRSVTPINLDEWVPGSQLLDDEEASIYSMDSYTQVISIPRVQSLHRSKRHAVPQITLTPPSVPTSPVKATSMDYSMPVFSETQCATHAVQPISEGISQPEKELSVLAGAAELLEPATPQTTPEGPLEMPPDVSDTTKSNDDGAGASITKKGRRNGRHLETSSIDIIMAGLEQNFPDTPINSPPISQESYGGFPPSLIETTSEGVSDPSDIGANPDNDPCPTVSRFSFVSTEIDVSEETLVTEEQPESKFSDSSDEEDGPELVKIIDSTEEFRPRISWPFSRIPFFDPCSALSTIVEEEEHSFNNAGIGAFNARATKAVLTGLEPPAVISGLVSSPPHCHKSTWTTLCRAPKRKWVSMIETRAANRSLGRASSRTTKHLSAPASTSSRLTRSLEVSPSTGLPLNIFSEHALRSSFVKPKPQRPKSVIRPLILPRKVAMRDYYDDDTSKSSIQLYSLDRAPYSSGDILADSFEQGPSAWQGRQWTLYKPNQFDGESFTREGARSVSLSSSSSSILTSTFDLPASMVTPDRAHIIAEELPSPPTSASIGSCMSRCDSPRFLNNIASPNEGLGGILAILDTLDFQTACGPRDSVSGIASPKFEYSSRWSLDFDVDGYCADSEDPTPAAAIAV